MQTIIRTPEVLKPFIASCFITAFNIGLLLLQPFVISLMLRHVNTEPYKGHSYLYIMLLIAAMLLATVLFYLSATLNNRVLQQVRFYSKHLLYADILRKPLSFFQKNNEGTIEAWLAQASLAARFIVNEGLNVVIRAIFFIVLSSILIFFCSFLYGIIFAIGSALYLFLSYKRAKAASSFVHAAVAANVELAKEAADILANIEVVQFTNKLEDEEQRIRNFLMHEKEVFQQSQSIIDCNSFWQKLFLTVIFVIFIAFWSFTKNLAVGMPVMFYIIGLLSYTQLEVVGQSLNNLFEQGDKLESVLKTISYRCPSERGSHPIVPPKAAKELGKNYGILIENLSFSYGSSNSCWENFNLSIPQGSHLLLEGPSGSGKSTLLKLLTGQLEPTKGKILIDGRKPTSMSFAEKAHFFTLISQQATLFSRSLYENTVYGLQDIPKEKVEDILLALGLENLKKRDPKHWLDLRSDKNGLDLSGGERQRILLARAILSAKPIIFLDEATSALDKPTEKKVLEVLHHFLKDSTIIAISHHRSIKMEGYQLLKVL